MENHLYEINLHVSKQKYTLQQLQRKRVEVLNVMWTFLFSVVMTTITQVEHFPSITNRPHYPLQVKSWLKFPPNVTASIFVLSVTARTSLMIYEEKVRSHTARIKTFWNVRECLYYLQWQKPRLELSQRYSTIANDTRVTRIKWVIQWTIRGYSANSKLCNTAEYLLS